MRSLQADGADDAVVVLLPDGPDAALGAALKAEPTLADLPQCGTAEPLGPPACFNRLAARSDAAVVVLVESGTVLGPGCLSLLVQALAQPGRGLAGPSTNRSWNEQARVPRRGPVRRGPDAALARRRFGTAVRSLEPLHSLADFCLAVGRQVIEAIGGADEEYGTRAVLGDGLQHPGRPGRLPRRVGGRRLRLPVPAHRAPPRSPRSGRWAVPAASTRTASAVCG